MYEIALSPLAIAGFAALGLLGTAALIRTGLIRFARWVDRQLQEYHETQRIRENALSEHYRRLRANDRAALERVERERELGH